MEADSALSKAVRIVSRSSKVYQGHQSQNKGRAPLFQDSRTSGYGAAFGRHQSPYTGHGRIYNSQSRGKFTPGRPYPKKSIFDRFGHKEGTPSRPTDQHLRLEAESFPKQGKYTSKLADYTGQMDNGYSTEIQNTLCAGATSNMLTSLCTQPGAKLDNHTRDRISSEEGSYTGDSITGGGGLCEQCFLDSQEQGKVEADPKFEGLESVRNLRTLQDGGHPLCEGSPKPGGLYVQIRPQGCISLYTNSSVLQEVPEVYMAREDIRVHSPPFRTLCCSESIHEAIEANTGVTQGERLIM